MIEWKKITDEKPADINKERLAYCMNGIVYTFYRYKDGRFYTMSGDYLPICTHWAEINKPY